MSTNSLQGEISLQAAFREQVASGYGLLQGFNRDCRCNPGRVAAPEEESPGCRCLCRCLCYELAGPALVICWLSHLGQTESEASGSGLHLDVDSCEAATGTVLGVKAIGATLAVAGTAVVLVVPPNKSADSRVIYYQHHHFTSLAVMGISIYICGN